jgi:hypothetical protein
MSKQNTQSDFGYVGLKQKPELVGTVIVYERKTGRVVHTHQFVHLGKGERPSKAVMEQQALKFVGSTGDGLDVLHQGDVPMKSNSLYRVDLRTKALVESVRK